MNTFTLRRAGVEDAATISNLFSSLYQNSSHPFQSVSEVTEFLRDDRSFQIVAKEGDRLVAFMAMTCNRWNDSYELGRAVTLPEYRRRGLAALLMQQVVEWVGQAGLGELVFGYPRVRRIAALCANLDPKVVVTGHDAGRNVANGTRETHLVVCGILKHARFVHLAPPVPQLLGWKFISERIYAPLALRPSPGDYPKEQFVGELSPQIQEYGGWILEYAKANGSLEIKGCRSFFGPNETVRSLNRLLTSHPSVQHVTATLLADKATTVRALLKSGFELTAYLPAWYKVGQFRFDCVQVVRRLFASRPNTQDLDPILASLELELSSYPYIEKLQTQPLVASTLLQ